MKKEAAEWADPIHAIMDLDFLHFTYVTQFFSQVSPSLSVLKIP